MDLQKWQKIEEIFQAALDLSSEEREEFIREKCGADDELRREVEKFINRFEEEETFLESPVWTDSRFLQSKVKREIADSLEDDFPLEKESKYLLGQQIGVYKLVKEIGQGGMGMVFLGKRADGEFRQKVAVKLIKRGMDTDFIIRRFRNERQILADLSHPFIASLLDGGTTKDGSPYFIMEFIEGSPLLKYCSIKNLDLRRKLELFQQICAAISYAHNRKIIHRDIKPSNILVTSDGVPKLLDFGIAKILDPDLIDDSLAPTASQMRLMTPEYASPEQIKGEEITPASDQYSLGVLLYELITGRRPYKFPSRAPHEIARVICEEIPLQPSSGEFGKFIAQDEDFQFSADSCQKLDRIVLKTLRKNPSERYSSVEDLTGDVAQFLSNQTVRAETFNIETGENKSPATNLKFQDRTKFITDENNPVSAEDKNRLLYAQTETTMPPKMISPRRKGIKQGFFLMILAFLIIPFLLVFTATGLFFPQLSVFFVVLFFFGGLTRIVYALLFEEKYPTPLLPAAFQNEITEAETKLIEAVAPRKTIVENEKPITTDKIAESEKIIAVLPFTNLNPESGMTTGGSEFLNVGLADALITRLSNVRKLLVRPTSSVIRFGAEESDIFAAGRELKVEYILTGTILRTQQKIRVSIQLLDIEKNAYVWAGSFNEDFRDILEIEDSISANVVELLLPKLTGEERRQVENRGTENAEAHESYLRGRAYWNSFTEEGFRQAKFYYEKAIELDPNYTLAFAGLTDYYLWLGAYAMVPPKDCFPPARKAAEKAVALDNESAEAHSALGFAQLCDGYHWEQSEKSALRAIELNPNYISTYLWYASHHFGREKYEEGLRLVRHAIKLDPLSFQNHNSLAYGLYFARRYDEAIAKAEDNIKRFPAFSLPYNALSNFLRRVGRGKESLEASNRALELSTDLDRMPTLFNRVSALAAAGKLLEAEELLREIESQYTHKHISSREYVLVYSSLGEKEKTLAALEKSFAESELLIWLKCEPSLDILRDEPRFQELLKKINQPLA